MSADKPNSTAGVAKPYAGGKTKDVPWYFHEEDLPEVDPTALNIFVKYSHIPQSMVQAHVLKNVSLASREGSTLFRTELVSFDCYSVKKRGRSFPFRVSAKCGSWTFHWRKWHPTTRSWPAL
jgi:hypothetical protein